MATLNDIFDLVKTLSENDREKLKDMISNTITQQNDLIHYVTEKRFSSGAFCPHCKSNHIKRNGHKNNVQRYLCLDCKKTFNITTNTIVSSTKKDLSVWNQYIDCMMGGYSIRKAAEKCGINKSTAFEWRHKILDALQNMAESVKLDGIIEGDETFFSISYKGNHKNSKFVMPRESHHRGKQTHIRGLSHEKVCVPCAINRNGLSIAKVSNLGRVSSQNLHNVFDNRIKGVSTKYLNNYLIWNNILNYSKETWPEKKNIFMSYVLTTDKKVLSKEIKNRPALPIIA